MFAINRVGGLRAGAAWGNDRRRPRVLRTRARPAESRSMAGHPEQLRRHIVQFSYFIPTRILFGAGMLEELGNIKLPGRKALIVISAGQSMKKLGYLDRVTGLLPPGRGGKRRV